METHAFSNGSWRKAKQIFVKYNGNWVECREKWVRVNGSWQLVFNKDFQFVYTIGTGYDFNLYNTAISVGWDGVTPLSATLTLSGILGASSISVYAFNTGVLPSGSTITLTINAGSYIVGCGGKGQSGSGSGTSSVTVTPAQNGGNALYAQAPITIINNGTIAGGGGGGQGRGIVYGHGFSGFLAGGGGAGKNPGAGGTGINGNGSAGTLTSGGNGGSYGGMYGAAGGALGSQGATTAGGWNQGYGGYAIVGAANVTFLASGTLLGGIS